MTRTMQAVRVHEFGDPEVLRLEESPLPVIGANEVLMNVEYSGVNMVDTYWRRGLPGYRADKLPFTPGMEGGGIVEAVGSNVSYVRPGDRVVAVMHRGSYAEHWAVPEDKVVPVPNDVDMRSAVAVALQGFTAFFLTHRTWSLKRGDTILVHAAAGGIGGLLSFFASRQAVSVIGTCSTDEKKQRAIRCGCEYVIRYDEKDFEDEVRRITEGKGVNVVFDSVGFTTFEKSLRCIRNRGLMCLFGQSSGEVAPVDPQVLRARGSLFLTRPTLTDYIRPYKDFLSLASEVFGFVADGRLQPAIHLEVSLSELPHAHKELESRGTAGKVIVRIAK